MNSAQTTPYALLTPDCVLNAVDSLGGASRELGGGAPGELGGSGQYRADGRLLALNSYENRVYQVGIEDGPMLVAKFYRPGRWSDAAILEEHAFVQQQADQELPVVAALRIADRTLHEFAGYRFALFPKCAGRAPELGDNATLEWLGRLIGRMHAIGAVQPFRQRPVLDIASFGEEPRNYLLSQGFIPADLRAAWESVVQQALDVARCCFERAGPVVHLRLHGDCHGGNVLWIASGELRGPHFVDFDDSRMGPAVQDLWMLLSGEREDRERQLADVLKGYRRFHDFNLRELHLIEALRTLRLIHYAAWLARRWDDPAFPHAFPWFNTQRYWQDRILELREQIALMEEAPIQFNP